MWPDFTRSLLFRCDLNERVSFKGGDANVARNLQTYRFHRFIRSGCRDSGSLAVEGDCITNTGIGVRPCCLSQLAYECESQNRRASDIKVVRLDRETRGGRDHQNDSTPPCCTGNTNHGPLRGYYRRLWTKVWYQDSSMESGSLKTTLASGKLDPKPVHPLKTWPGCH